ncbi:URE2 protein [Apiospora rasikravindrae]|uniref:URE2 protein n=1 Tax=Apiospora rasikravindrae TaxID=990691 RepID=A0ABR1TXJ9_9PEZI
MELTLAGIASGPNPWKVVMILEELGVPYEEIFPDPSTIKQEPYTSLNPNGRIPTIQDPNTGITLWESGAIIEYLVDTYDKEKKLSFDTSPEKYHVKQFLIFQVSGQGPYYGQLVFFQYFHPEKVKSAIQRYEEQTLRVISVLDKCLEGKEYLVGGKCRSVFGWQNMNLIVCYLSTYADISFIAWETVAQAVVPEFGQKTKQYANYHAWLQRLMARPAIAKTLERKAAMAAH